MVVRALVVRAMVVWVVAHCAPGPGVVLSLQDIRMRRGRRRSAVLVRSVVWGMRTIEMGMGMRAMRRMRAIEMGMGMRAMGMRAMGRMRAIEMGMRAMSVPVPAVRGRAAHLRRWKAVLLTHPAGLPLVHQAQAHQLAQAQGGNRVLELVVVHRVHLERLYHPLVQRQSYMSPVALEHIGYGDGGGRDRSGLDRQAKDRACQANGHDEVGVIGERDHVAFIVAIGDVEGRAIEVVELRQTGKKLVDIGDALKAPDVPSKGALDVN